MRKNKESHITTLISRSTRIKGDIHFSGSLEIEGRVEGNVIADDEAVGEVRIRETGEVQGELKSPRIIINGLVEGDVYALENLELASKAKVVGNVHYSNMEMVMGAEVNGSLYRNEGQEIKQLSVDKPDDVLSEGGATV